MEERIDSSEGLSIEKFELELNDSAKMFLKEAVKWAYFLSIIGYIGVGFIILMAVFSGAFFAFIGNLSQEMNDIGLFGGSFLTGIYLLIATLYFFPIYYLNRFASKAKAAFRMNDSESLAKSFEYLKSHYKYIGIVAIITLCFYGLFILGALVVTLAVWFK